MIRIRLLFSTIALFIKIELLCNSIRRIPPNRANGVAVFEGSLIRDDRACYGTCQTKARRRSSRSEPYEILLRYISTSYVKETDFRKNL